MPDLALSRPENIILLEEMTKEDIHKHQILVVENNALWRALMRPF